jgi:RsiW-degrading membrane proteinase PrsW (M82 family)
VQATASSWDQTIECPHCKTSIRIPASSAERPQQAPFIARFSEKISSTAGVEKLEGFSLRDMFSDVFSKHSDEEIERYFTVGTPETTPSLQEVDTRWPRPWLFFRAFVISVVVYLCFVQAWNQYGNVNLVPGLIIVGSFAVPFATLVFFFEMNAARNVSLYQVIKLVMLGGVLSLMFSLVLFQVTGALRLSWLGASVAALAEEPGKLLALMLVVNKRRYPHLLNGLLFGAAIGTGFAAFESAGYALRYALDGYSMQDIILSRGLMAPFSHIVWTAMSAAALWRVKGDADFQIGMLNDARFKRVFLVAVALHMLWNADIELPFQAKQLLLGAIAWVIVFGLIQEGLKQLRSYKTEHSALPPVVLAADQGQL